MRGVALALFVAGCGHATPPTEERDPFAPQADTAEGLTDLSPTRRGARARRPRRRVRPLPRGPRGSPGGSDDRKAKLLCGKSMFFYETFATAGLPAVLPKFLVANFPTRSAPGSRSSG